MNEQERAIDRVLGALEGHGSLIKPLGGYWMAQCPAHDDHDPSLSITAADDRVLLFCHGHCTTNDVLGALSLRYRDLFDGAAPSAQVTGELVCEYLYRDAEGIEIGAVQRYRNPKDFRPLKPVGDHDWRVGASPALKFTPYRADEVRTAIRAGRPILVVEGERDVDTAWLAGLAATCNQGGAGKWRAEHAEHLRGAEVTIVRDQDPPGRQHAKVVAESLASLARVRIVDPAEGCKDFTDHVEAGHGVEQLVEVTNDEEYEVYEGTKEPPVLHPVALHGLLGEVVRRLAPATEASPAAMLAQLLAYVGAMIGDQVVTMVGGSPHPGRVWPLVIGPTASGRKGESRAQVRRFVSPSSSFSSYDVTEASGLGTGEGVLARLRAEDGTGRTVVVSETEFGRTLAASRREGNTLSHVLRDLWDEGRAETMTKADPVAVEGAHLIVIAHITPRELRLKLAEVDVSGGLANRYLMIWSRRSGLLPDQAPPPDTSDLSTRLDHAVERARSHGRIVLPRTGRAAQFWRRLYCTLAELEPEGMLGELVARASAYVSRLALIFAVIDERDKIDAVHLRAALAVVAYSMDSAAYIFGGVTSTGDLGKLAAAVRAAGADGMTRTEVSKLFSKNKSAAQLDVLIGELADTGNVTVVEETGQGAGRPPVRLAWTATSKPDAPRLAAMLDELVDVDPDAPPVCARCRRPSADPLIGRKCRSCAYPPGTESPYSSECAT